MEKLADILKIFADKHLIPSAASLAVAILGVAFQPEAFGISNQVGKFLYGVLIFCLCFLLIQFGKYSTNLIKNVLAKKKKKDAEKKRNEQLLKDEEKEKMENLWRFVDSLSLQDKNYLRVFLKNRNTPIERMGGEPYYGLLSNENSDRPSGIHRNNTMEYEGRQVYVPDNWDYSGIKLYKLTDDFYELLEYSCNKYKRISHFDMEEENNGQTEDAHAE